MKSVLYKLLGIAVIVAALGESAAQAQGMPPTLVEVDTVTTRAFHDQLTLIGRSEAIVQSNIVSEVDGRVVAVGAEEGVAVKAGTTLMRIDPARIQYLLLAKEAEARQAEAEASLARSNLRRVQELYDQNMVSESALDSIRAWTTMREGRFAQLSAERDNLQRDLDNCTIEAPFTGYTGRQLVDVGGWVGRGTPIFEMVDLSKVKITVDLPERYFGHLSIGSPVQVTVSNDTLTTVTGKVTGIAPKASKETHTFPVIITANNASGRLGSGMLVRVRLSLDRVFSSLAVSKDAVVRQGLQTMIYTVVDGKASPVPVKLSSTDGKMVAIAGDGLSEGMPVVVKGNERIFPGSPVRTAGGEPQGSGPAAGGDSPDTRADAGQAEK